MYFSIRLLHSSCDLPGRISTQPTPEASGPSVCGHPQVPHEEQPLQRCYTPIVGLVWLPDGEEFQEDRKNTYLYETLGGNNSRVAMQELLDEDDLRFRTRLVSVYCHLTDNQALRLASKHNLATSVHHEMSTSDKVSDIKFELRFTATDYRHTL